MNPLVSVIVPCYNGENKIKKFLDSLLEQTYSNMEIIFVNDGSTDATENIVLSYKEKFESKKNVFIYIKQENKGQAAAINKGLKIFKGDYFIWPDSDDILDKNNIRAKVNYLEKHKKYALVYCNTKIVSEFNIDQTIEKWNRLNESSEKLFEDIITARNIVYAGGAWMARSEYFLLLRPERQIEEINGIGQNWQLLLPLVKNYPCGKVNKFLFTYVVYEKSHSHVDRNYGETIKELYIRKKAIKIILNNMRLYNNFYRNLIKNNFIEQRFDVACTFLKIKDIDKFYLLLLKRNIKISKNKKIKYFLIKIGLYSLIRKIHKVLLFK